MSTTSSTSSLPRENSPRGDVYSRITDQIAGLLEQGVRPWVQPWQGGHAAGPVSRPLRHNGQRYSGINVLVLWMEAEIRNFGSPIWMTYKQAQELKAQVRKGEKGTPVVYASSFKKEEENDAGESVEREIHFLREYWVFNVDQIDNLPGHFYAKAGASPAVEKLERIAQVESFVAATKADIRHGGSSAFYLPSEDYIQVIGFKSNHRRNFFSVIHRAHDLANTIDQHVAIMNRCQSIRRRLYLDIGVAMFIAANVVIWLRRQRENWMFHRRHVAFWCRVKNIADKEIRRRVTIRK